MSDYKGFITETLKTVAGKVKEVTESESVKTFVEKVKVAAETSTVRDLCEQGVGKAKAYGNIAKLSLELNGEREELKRVFAEIGQLYYEQAKDAPDEFFATLFAKAEQMKANIAAKEDEIAFLKSETGRAEEDIDVEIAEFEDVVDETAADGTGTEPVEPENNP